uniref:Polycystin family receptor for egg jelly n=1 Tax=Meleagris gallopavo TaxID=9103 RepID=A0A803YE13_MELGA
CSHANCFPRQSPWGGRHCHGNQQLENHFDEGRKLECCKCFLYHRSLQELVWHNNRGPSPGWFLSRAKVEHVSARKTWFFMCRKWLALDKGDGLLERTFSVTNPKAPLSRKDYFLIDLASGLKEGHLWLSVFAQVLPGTYSRLQRLSSCLTILLLNLFVNIMFFNANKNEESPRHLRYLRSIAIGIECALTRIPVEMIIKALFKYSQKNPQRNLPLLPGNLKTWRELLSQTPCCG